jgi:small subunit ribosomal protein S6
MLLNEYETTYIIRPDLTDDVLATLNQKYESLITNNNGTMLVSEDWGKRKLCYLLKKHNRGHYIYLNYVAPAAMITELERNMNNEDSLLRYLTVQIASSVDVDTRKVLAEERRRLRIERMAAQKAEEEAEARYRAEMDEAEDDAAPESDE